MPGAIYKGNYSPLQKELLESLYHILLPEITMIASVSLTDRQPYINSRGEVGLRSDWNYDITFVFSTQETKLLNPTLVDVLALYKDICRQVK